jgi:hypothetical protein
MIRILGFLALASAALAGGPEYDAHGALLRPKQFREWVFVGSSVGLSYADVPNRKPPGLIHNVYINPESYQQYVKTGKFPERTVFVLALYEPEEKVSPSKHGYFPGKLVAVEAAVKDKQHFKDGWAYFDFGGRNGFAETAKPQASDRCYSCHVQHAKDDNVFVQFYPVLRRLKDGD